MENIGGAGGGAISKNVNNMETPVRLRKLGGLGEGEFSGFREEQGNMRRLVTAEREIRCMRELIAGILERQDEIEQENNALKCQLGELEGIVRENKEMKKELEQIRKENEVLMTKCEGYEVTLEGLEKRVEDNSENREKEEGVMYGAQLQELRNVWKKEQEEEKVSFSEVVKKQIQEKTQDVVIQVIKEKEDLVRDTVDKKKCLVIFGLKEKKNLNKYVREREERELVKKIIQTVQESTQELEKDVEETYRIGKYIEGGKRPLKVRMRSQVTVEEILAKTGKLAQRMEYKDIWIKRDMNLEEREKERELRNEAREKNEMRTETEKEKFFWRVLDMKLRKWFIKGRREVIEETRQQTGPKEETREIVELQQQKRTQVEGEVVN